MTISPRTTRVVAASALALAMLAPALASAQAVSVPVTASANVTTSAAAGPAGVSAHAHVRASAVSSTTVAQRKAGREASSTDRMAKVQDKSAAAIDARIQALTQLSAHLGAMKLVPAGDISSMQAAISSEISALTTLKATIGSDTSTTSLKADASSITKGYRVYMLVIPQDRIVSAADRVLAVAGQMQALSAKFAARISQAGTVNAAVTSAMTDFNAKIADAQAQANAAVSAVANLTPDNGDAGLRASNTAALKASLAHIKTAHQDLVSARADANVIMKGVAGKAGASHEASTTASVNSQA